MQFTVRETQITVTPLILLAIALGGGVAGYAGYDYIQQSNAVDDAIAVETTVTDTEISKSAGQGISYRVSVRHTYQYRGAEYTSEQVFPGSISPMYFARSDAERVIEPYEANETTTAYVDPSSPSVAFLERETTLAPFTFVGFGGLVVVLTMLHAAGAPNPGQNTELRPEREFEPTRDETLFGINRDTVNRLSKRFMIIAPVVLILSLIAMVAFLYTAESSSMQASLTDPIVLTVLTAFVAGIALVGALVLYGFWSFTEYRRLRERIPEPRPPSPLRHPSRLVTILYTNDELDTYGRRVKLTGFAFTVAVFLLGVFVSIFVTAA
ncbi:DUF3592 domain-containing protein [Halorhabdus rudnickae]|uniref:DUF3592 domain-containing protein n=1 Tax=Halorhabdus rudnickae TaxID=1775544 RepID=UPI001083F482|nr:DUF3592 domain-containing protein [Halorhabdus rudnickae]